MNRTRELINRVLQEEGLPLSKSTSEQILEQIPEMILIRISGIADERFVQSVAKEMPQRRETRPGLKHLDQKQNVYMESLIANLEASGYGLVKVFRFVGDERVIFLQFTKDRSQWQKLPRTVALWFELRAQFVTVYVNQCPETGARIDSINITGFHRPVNGMRESLRLTFDGKRYGLVALQ